MAKLSLNQALLKAKSHEKNREIKEAQKLYHKVLQVFPMNKRAQNGLAALKKSKPSAKQGSPQDMINQLVNLYNRGQLTTVVLQAQALIRQYPDAFIIWNILGAANKGLGKTFEASEAFKKVTEINPNYADGHSNLGVTLREQGKLEESITSLNKALSLKSDYTEAHYNMGVTFQDQGKLDQAITSYKKALSLKSDYTEAHYNMGVTFQDQGKLDEAIKFYKKALSLKPDYAEAYNNLGNALKDQGKLDEAVTSYKKALSLKPDYAEAYNNMGNALKDQGKQEEAITSYKKALSLKPDYAEAYNNMGNALQDLGKLDEAITSYNKSLSLKPDYAEVHKNVAHALKDQGKLDEAIISYNKSLSLNPDYAEVYRNLSSLIEYKSEDTQVALVGEMIKRSDLKDDDRCQLKYTYAKMNEDLGDLGAAYDNYSSGGKLRKKLLSYDFKQDKLTFEQIKNLAPKLKEFAFSKPFDPSTNTPIFILGMPRSGSTLVEQIISSHSKVYGAGELPFLSRFANSNNIYNQSVSSESILEVRKNYLIQLEKVSHGKLFVTDKMPQNFQHISILLKALPEAKVIHVKRDPAATCWSNFKHYFSKNALGYSYDLKDVVNYFKLYQDLMDFWDQQYNDQIYHLDYDKLVVEQDTETRKLIEYLELGWEDDCLFPHHNKRSVKTASQQQVREKVYANSSQAWRKFEPYLNGIFDEFEHISALPLK